MAFPFHALIDGELVVKMCAKKTEQGGARPTTLLTDTDGVVYERSRDDEMVFVPSEVEPVERYEETPVSHEPQAVTLNDDGADVTAVEVSGDNYARADEVSVGDLPHPDEL